MAFKRPWLAPGGPPPTLTAWTGLENMVGTGRATPRPDCMDRLRKNYSHLAEGWFLARKAAWALSGCMSTDSADYYVLLMSGCGQSHETAFFRPEVASFPGSCAWAPTHKSLGTDVDAVDVGAVLESELGQKWGHGPMLEAKLMNLIKGHCRSSDSAIILA